MGCPFRFQDYPRSSQFTLRAGNTGPLTCPVLEFALPFYAATIALAESGIIHPHPSESYCVGSPVFRSLFDGEADQKEI